MDIDLSADQDLYRHSVRKFLESEIPLLRVREFADNPAGFDRAWWQQGVDLGWTLSLIPEEYGGSSLAGEGLLDLVIVAEEMGRLVSPGPLLATNVVASGIAECGTPVQQASYLPLIITGEIVATWALYESGSHWQPDSIQLEARSSGDGFLLRGVKFPVEAAAQADLFLVTARMEEGLTQFLVPADTAGLSVIPMESLDLVRRYAEVHFDDVQVPGSAVLGKLGDAGADVERLLQVALALQCAETCGAVDRVFEFTLEYMFDRFSFGRPLASYQALKHRFADMKMWLEASHATATSAARAVQARAEDAALLVSAAKSYIGEYATRIIQECVQMHGGMGVTWDHDIHLYLRRATNNQVQYGTPAEHRERIAVLIGMDEGRA